MRLTALAAVCVWCACSNPASPPEATASAPPREQRVEKKSNAQDEGQQALPSLAKADPSLSRMEKRVNGGNEGLEAVVSRANAGKPAPSSDRLAGGASLSGDSTGSALGLGGLGLRGTGAGGGAVGSSAGLGLGGTSGAQAGRSVRGAGGGSPVATAFAEPRINDWVDTATDHLSTFAADVDTASYAHARRHLREGALPPPAAVRVEEFLNYFRYTYPQPKSGALAVTLDAAPSPFSPGMHLLRVGVQGRQVAMSERKVAHLTFLVDVSGSMAAPDRLPLAKRALRLLVDNLHDGDTVALVTYAGSVRVVLPPTGLEHKAVIHEAIEDLRAGGGTAMGSGIELAYQQAMKTLDSTSLSRVIILSDGDANIGRTTPQALLQLIAGYVKEGVTVTTVGFGVGNYRDNLMEQFANQGNGNHAYVDSLLEARRVFQTQLGGTLEVIAQDVKLQVDFDPAQVKRYRLVGYENRDLADADFRNDRVDAGEIGSGHTVTALYEVELAAGAGEGLCTVRVRAKQPRGTEASEAAFRFQAGALAARFDAAPRDLRFATAVMGAAELFRQSAHARRWSFDAVREIARGAAGDDAERREFLALLEQARPTMKALAAR